ncbi:YjbQ family protein [Candidatus Micrarchaeota archaeon]|nr:YjbQ family protein [Candidatus Micrarchaeota archaeon]
MELIVNTNKKIEFIDITDKVNMMVHNSAHRSGICIVYVPHTTAALMVNEFEPHIVQDYKTFYMNLTNPNLTNPLEQENEHKIKYQHNEIDNNAESHLLSSLIGPSKQFIVKDKHIILGTWQRIILCEFDGPRERHIIIEIQ